MIDSSNQDECKHSIVLFDGECNFCNKWVRFICNRDTRKRFKFASLQSQAASKILASFNAVISFDSIVLIESGKLYARSTAVLRILRQLDGPIKGLYALLLIPKIIRDSLYRIFSANRYRFFGKQDSCALPHEDLRARFL